MNHLQQQLRTLRLVETANELPTIIQQAEKEEVIPCFPRSHRHL